MRYSLSMTQRITCSWLLKVNTSRTWWFRWSCWFFTLVLWFICSKSCLNCTFFALFHFRIVAILSSREFIDPLISKIIPCFLRFTLFLRPSTSRKDRIWKHKQIIWKIRWSNQTIEVYLWFCSKVLIFRPTWSNKTSLREFTAL